MIINQKWVKEQSACEGGAKWFNDNYSKDVEGYEVVETLIKDKAIAKEHSSDTSLSWANWLIVRLMTRKQYLQYAVFAAEQAILIYEKKNPPEKLMHDCIDAAKAVIENDTAENRNKSAAAWDASWDAAWAAARAAARGAAWDASRDAFRDAAWDAARAAARAAAWAAASDAAWAAAWAAASDAASDAAKDAARAAMLKKILKYGVGLLNR